MRAREALPDRLSRTPLLPPRRRGARRGRARPRRLLVRQHAHAHAGSASFCSINDYVNCDRVATSRYSVVLGLPVAVWGVLGYGLALLLALAGPRAAPPPRRLARGAPPPRRGRRGRRPPSCSPPSRRSRSARSACSAPAPGWSRSRSSPRRGARAGPRAPPRAVRGDLALVRERPYRAAGLAVAGLALVLLVAAAYPRYWARPARPARARRRGRPAPRPAARQAPPPRGRSSSSSSATTSARPARAPTRETKALLAVRPGVQLVRRHFPLDSACNPAVNRRMHPRGLRPRARRHLRGGAGQAPADGRRAVREPGREAAGRGDRAGGRPRPREAPRLRRLAPRPRPGSARTSRRGSASASARRPRSSWAAGRTPGSSRPSSCRRRAAARRGISLRSEH